MPSLNFRLPRIFLTKRSISSGVSGLSAGWKDRLNAMLFLSAPSGMPVPAVVIDVTPEAVTLDANHELAGKDLNFDIELVEIEG